MNNPPLPPLDYAPDSFFAVGVPDSFVLPQQNPYCGDLSADQICILIAGFQYLAGQSGTSAATLLAAVEVYVGDGGFDQSLQVPGTIYTLLQAILNVPSSAIQGVVVTGSYGGVKPGFTPSAEVEVAVDDVTGEQWIYVSGEWS